MGLLKKFFLERCQISFRTELLLIMMPACLYIIVAYGALNFSKLIAPNPHETERYIKQIKANAANGDYGPNPDQAVRAISGRQYSTDEIRSIAAYEERFVAGSIIAGVIIQICFAMRVYYSRKANTPRLTAAGEGLTNQSQIPQIKK